MGWERRGTNAYFYGKERRGDKVVSIYFGRGVVAALAADLLGDAKEEREYEQAKRSEEGEREREHQAVLQLGGEVLECAGYHRTRGEWRKKRAKSEDCRTCPNSE